MTYDMNELRGKCYELMSKISRAKAVLDRMQNALITEDLEYKELLLDFTASIEELPEITRVRKEKCY